MEYQKINCNSYNIHAIKSNKFKTVHLEVIFRNNYTRETLPTFTMLCDLLTDSCGSYKTRQEMAIRCEELYKLSLYGVNSKVGNQMFSTFVSEFIDPKYIKDPKYLENALSFILGCITKPNIQNKEFNMRDFNIVKNRILMEINTMSENVDRKSLGNALNVMDKESHTAFRALGSKEIIESITIEKMYKAYEDLFNHFLCDIYIIGNVTDEYIKIIKKHFKNRVIKEDKKNIMVENKIRKKPLEKVETANFGQSNLIMIYNIDDDKSVKANMAFHTFNNILVTGGLTSVLYQKLREEHSLCYGIKSMYLRYDGLLVLQVSLDKDNYKKAAELIKSSIKEMSKGNLVTQDSLEKSKDNLKLLLNSSKDNNVSILNTYLFNNVDGTPLFDEKIDMISKITLDDIKKTASSLKLNTVYTLLQGGEQNE